jgi:hypothetical protein
MADAWADLSKLQKRIDVKEVTSGDMFGTREYLKNNYHYRMAAAVGGIYGNSKMEAMYPIYAIDSDGNNQLEPVVLPTPQPVEIEVHDGVWSQDARTGCHASGRPAGCSAAVSF